MGLRTRAELFVEKALRSKWLPVSSAKLVIWRLFHLSNVGRPIPSCIPQYLRRNSKNEQKKMNHCSPWQCELSHIGAFLTGQNVDFMGHPPYSLDLVQNDLYLLPHIKAEMRGQRFSQTQFFVQLIFSSHCKQHK